MNFKIEVGELTLRSCTENLMQEGEHTRAEIVARNESGSVYTVAYWESGSLTYVDIRPLDHNQEDFSKLVRLGYELIDQQED